MGMTWTNLTCEDLCDLMCGTPEENYLEDNLEDAIRDGETEDTKDNSV